MLPNATCDPVSAGTIRESIAGRSQLCPNFTPLGGLASRDSTRRRHRCDASDLGAVARVRVCGSRLFVPVYLSSSAAGTVVAPRFPFCLSAARSPSHQRRGACERTARGTGHTAVHRLLSTPPARRVLSPIDAARQRRPRPLRLLLWRLCAESHLTAIAPRAISRRQLGHIAVGPIHAAGRSDLPEMRTTQTTALTPTRRSASDAGDGDVRREQQQAILNG